MFYLFPDSNEKVCDLERSGSTDGCNISEVISGESKREKKDGKLN